MKNPQKQFIFTCFPAIFRSRPHARFPLPAAYFCRDRFCQYGALPPCLFATAARRALYSPVPFESHTHAPRKFASEFAGKNKPHAFRLYLPHVLPLLPPHVFFPRPMLSPSVCVRFSRNKPHARPQRRFRAADIRGRTDDSRIKQKSHRQQPSFYLSASYAAPRRFSPPAATKSASKKHIKKNRSGETLLRNDSEIKNSSYFFAAATCFATSSLRSSLFFSKPSPIT